MGKNNIQKAREKLGLTQEEFAARTGLGRSTLANLERGRSQPQLLGAVSICHVLGITTIQELEELFWDREII